MQCPKFKQYSAITSKRYEIGCQLVLIINGNSYTSSRLVTSVTLNDLERRNRLYIALILHYFTEYDGYAGRLRHSG